MPELETLNEEKNINVKSEEEYFDAALIKKQRRKYFSSAMWKLTLSLLILMGIQLLIAVPLGVATYFLGEAAKGATSGFLGLFHTWDRLGYVETFNNIVQLFNIIIPDTIALLCFMLFTMKTPKAEMQNKKLGFGLWFALFIMTFGIGGTFSIIGMAVNALINAPAAFLGTFLKSFMTVLTSSNNVATSITLADRSWAYILVEIPVTTILVPIVEEYIFRKVLIDKTARYGFGPAILLSGLTFGIFHGNVHQFFYTVTIGFFFAYIYCYTGKIRHTIFMHMGYNFYSGAIIPLARKMIHEEVTMTVTDALEQLSLDQDINKYSEAFINVLAKHPVSILGMIAITLALLLYFLLIFAGLVLIICFLGKFLRYRKTIPLGEKGVKREAVFNFGSALFLAMGILLFGLNIVTGLFSTFASTMIF